MAIYSILFLSLIFVTLLISFIAFPLHLPLIVFVVLGALLIASSISTSILVVCKSFISNKIDNNKKTFQKQFNTIERTRERLKRHIDSLEEEKNFDPNNVLHFVPSKDDEKKCDESQSFFPFVPLNDVETKYDESQSFFPCKSSNHPTAVV
jgi:hypothetical protein